MMNQGEWEQQLEWAQYTNTVLFIHSPKTQETESFFKLNSIHKNSEIVSDLNINSV